MLDDLASALAQRRTVGILYRGHARVVDPVMVSQTHMLAWCCHRGWFRLFRLDRIEAAIVGPPIEALGPDVGPPIEVEA